jgi:hypothetical protein
MQLEHELTGALYSKKFKNIILKFHKNSEKNIFLDVMMYTTSTQQSNLKYIILYYGLRKKTKSDKI